MNKLEWWGYLHTSGTIQVKRYFGKQDLVEAQESPFVKSYTRPFMAKNGEEALIEIKKQLKQ